MNLQIEPIQRALPYLTLRECVEYATTNKATAAAVRRTIIARGVEWGVGGADESEEVLLGKVRALWSELPLFALYAPASMQYGDARPRGKEATLLALRALPLSDLVAIFSLDDYQLIAEEIPHVQRSVLAGSHGGGVKGDVEGEEEEEDDEEESVAMVWILGCRSHNYDVMNFLVDCCPQGPSFTLSSVAVDYTTCSAQLLEFLFEKKVLTIQGQTQGQARGDATLLHHAAGDHCLEAVRFLLAQRADPNAEDRRRETPLDYLFERHRERNRFESEITAALLESGADSNHVNAKGVFPLIATDCHTNIELLLRHGAQIEQQTKEGKRALHLLSKTPPCIALLLRWGADPHCVDKEGMTPLHDAVKCSVAQSIWLLFDAGSRLDQKTHDGRDAFDLAKDQPLILALLQRLQERGHSLATSIPNQADEWEKVEKKSLSPSLVFEIDALVQVIFSSLRVAEWAALSRLSPVARSVSARLMARRAKEWGVATAHEAQEKQCAALRALWEELPTFSLFLPAADQREIRRMDREALLNCLHTVPFAHCARLFLVPFYMRDASPRVRHVEASLFAASHPKEREEARLEDDEVWSLLEHAAYYHNLKLVHFLIAYGALEKVSIPSESYPSLVYDLPITTLLLDHHILTLDHKTPADNLFRTAIRGCHIALASLLLQRGADPNEGALDAEETPLLLLMKSVLACSYPFQSLAWSPQAHSLTSQNHSFLSALLEAGADPNYVDRWGQGMRALFLASDPIQLRLLLDHGAEIDRRNWQQETPLYHHVVNPKGADDPYGLIALLLQRGANPNATTPKGDRPLDFAWQPRTNALLRAAGASRGQPRWPRTENSHKGLST